MSFQVTQSPKSLDQALNSEKITKLRVTKHFKCVISFMFPAVPWGGTPTFQMGKPRPSETGEEARIQAIYHSVSLLL